MIEYSRKMGKVVAITIALTMIAPAGLTFTGSDIILADSHPTVTVITPGSEEQIYNGTILIDWLATDSEEDDALLDINIEYSPDGGTNWFTVMSGVDNNNPPYTWDTVAAGVLDGVSYNFNITAIDNSSQSGSNTSYMFSIDNTPNDRWYLQIESFNLGTHLDLDMKPSELEVQEFTAGVSAQGEIQVRTFASRLVAPDLVDLAGDWNFSIYAKVSSSEADGNLYANVYADDGVTQRLLFTTDYDDENVNPYLDYHEFGWIYSVSPGTLVYMGEHIVVEIMLNATSDPGSTTYYHYADSDIPVLGNVSGDYNETFASDNQYETIEEVDGGIRPNTIVLDEDFSTVSSDNQGYPIFPPDWRIINGGSNPPPKRVRTWTVYSQADYQTIPPPIIYPFASVYSAGRNTGLEMDEQLISPVFDLSFATSVSLEFDQVYYDHPGTNDNASVDIRSGLTNGTWQTLLFQEGQDSPSPDHQNIDITTWAAGGPDVEIRFHYMAEPDSERWLVDNILVKATIVNTSLLEHKWTIDVPAGEEPYEFNIEANRQLSNGDDDFVFAYSTDDVNFIDMITIDSHSDSTKTCWLPPTLSGTVYIRVRDTNRIADYDMSSIEVDQMFITSFSGPRLTLGFDHYSVPSFIEPALTLGPISYLCIQDAPGGFGTNVTTHSMDTSETFTVWAIGFDAGWNYISDIQANWTNTLNSQTATSSTVFTLNPTAPGSGLITAIYNATTSDTTGLITVDLFDFPPNVLVLTPVVENQIYNGPTLINWIATDNEDADPTLDITIEYSPDGGTNWFTLMSGTDNNNPPYAWDTVAAGVPDGVSYKFNITATDNANKSDSDISNMFSIDNTPNDRWYLQIESFNLGGHLDLDMKPSEPEVQEVSVDVSTPGEFPVQSFASEFVAHRDVDLKGDWNFSIYAKVSSSAANGSLYANVHADDGLTPRLLFTTDYDDETVGSYPTYHEFTWSYSVPPGTWIQPGEYVVVEIMLHATAGGLIAHYHYADADIPVLGNISGDYTMTYVSDNLHEIIEEIAGSPGEFAIIDEDFNGTFPPDGWQVVNGGGHSKWNSDNTKNITPAPPMLEPFACFTTVLHDAKPNDDQLITPVLDLSQASSVMLEFDLWYWAPAGPPFPPRAYVDVRSSLTNGDWVNLHNMTIEMNAIQEHLTFNLTPYAAGSSNVEIRFYLFGNRGVRWLVDNVMVNANIVTSSLLEHKWTIDVPAGEEPYEFNLEANRQLNNGDDDFVFAYSTDDVIYINMVTIDHHIDSTKTFSLPPTLSGTVYIRVNDTNRNSDYDISRIEIDQMFISSVGVPKLTIGFDHQSAPSFIEPALTLGPISYLCIQDAPGGIGNNVTTHTMTTDETFTVWSVGFDAGWIYVSEIPTNWTNTLNNQTSTSSTVFTLDPTAPGSGIITADFNATLSDTTGLITVTLGLLENIIIRDSAGGFGNEVGAYSMTTDDTLTVWSAGYDADGNYLGDINSNWSTNGTLDFQTANGVNNFTFDPTTAGTSGYITALNGTHNDSAGLITVGFGIVNRIVIRDGSGGGGSEVGNILLVLGQTLTVYSAGYDIDNNYIGDTPCNWTTTGTLNLTTATSSSSFTFEPAAVGETGTINATFNGTISDETGTITVIGSGIDYIIIEDGLGNEIITHTMDTTETFTVWAIGYNFTEGEICPVYADWTTTPTLDLQTATTSQSFTFDPIHAPTSGTIEGLYGILWDTTGTITVNLGPLSHLCIQDAPGGIGTNVTTHTMTTDDTFTLWAIGYDAEWNYISDIPSNWTNTLNAQTVTISTVFTLDPTAPGTGTITADFNATVSDMSGLITVTVGLFDNIIIRDSAGGFGNEVNAYSMTTDDTLTVWAAGYDADGNFIIDVNCDWSTNGTLDFQTDTMVNSFTFDPSTSGSSGYIMAINSSVSDSAGLITVGIGALDHIIIRHEAGGAGSEVTNVTMLPEQTLIVYSAGYDIDNNYIGDIPCNWTTTGTLNFTTTISSPSFTFEPAAAGESGTINATFNATISDVTGTITVTDSGIDYIRIEDGSGNQIFAHTMDATETFTVWAIGYNFTEGEICPVYANWTTTPTLDLQTATASQSFTFDPIHAPTLGLIMATFELEWDQAGPITVNPGPLANLCIQDAPGGTGANVTTHTMTTGETFTVWAIGYDEEWNYISNINCDWATTGTLDIQSAAGTSTFPFSPVNPGTGSIIADYNATIGEVTGLITVTEPIPTFDIDITPAISSNGWILISFPNQVEGDPLSIIVDAVNEGAGLVTWDIVQWYDPTSPSGDEWKTTATFKPPPLNTFNYVNNTYSFWIHILNYGDGNLTIQGDLATTGEWATIELIAGWNLVGYPFQTAQVMTGTFGILINLDMPVETYDPADPYRLRTVDISTEDHEPGCGYWVHVAADEILTIQCP